jgi:hypothetical protein
MGNKVCSLLYNEDIYQIRLEQMPFDQLHDEKQLYKRLIKQNKNIDEYNTVEIFNRRLRMAKLEILKRTLTGDPDGTVQLDE